MSISINSHGNVLVGMPFINRVFLLSVNISDPRKLTYVSRNTGGRSLGNGKSVAWLDDGNMAAILVNTYSLTYQWSSSQIFFYDMVSNTYNSNSTPLSLFPNYHQLVPDSFNSVFLNIISSPTSLTLMDKSGDLLIFNPTPPGFFPSITDTGSMPLITSEEVCLPGIDIFYRQYPFETSSGSYFDCEESIRNAKFEIGLQSMAIPRTHAEERIFDLLYEQNLMLHVDFINILAVCDSISLTGLFGTTWSTIR
ncbi:unnamed protein product [Rotaria sordida]|uniref:Uncharacterized protein n=1 Tax=Rotaria sordida TaxID=392033 RepID=A0A814DGE5_9BILA|nr:unnamed protein product [Rotaria sordida]CAF0955485.1 unnamed protein product [Rotaria sordida]